MEDFNVWHLAVNGKQSGPFSEKQIIEKIKAGKVDKNYFVFRAGQDEWRPIDASEKFAEFFMIPPPPPPGNDKDKVRPGPPPGFFVRMLKTLSHFLILALLGIAGFYGGAMLLALNIIPYESVGGLGQME